MYSPRSSTEGPLDAVMGTGGLFDTKENPWTSTSCSYLQTLFRCMFQQCILQFRIYEFFFWKNQRIYNYTPWFISWYIMTGYDMIWYDMICHIYNIYIYLNYIIFLLLYTVCTHPGLPWPIPYLRPLGPGQRSHPHSGAQHEPKAPLRCDEEKHTLW